jgi:uncharacterized protein (DUF58 family)
LRKYFRASKSRSSAGRAWFSRRIFPFSFGITLEGILFLAGVLVLSIAAIHTGNNLLFIILAALLSTIAVSGIVSRNSLKQVSLSLRLPENVFAEERVSIKVSLRNLKKVFPSFSIRVEDPALRRRHSPFQSIKWLVFSRRRASSMDPIADRAVLRQAAYFPVLRAGETRSEFTVQSFPHRGLYSLNGFWISTRFPFGFFRRGERVGAKGEVLVFPLVQKISSFFHLLPFLPGHLEGLHVGLGENLFSIRKYQESESARMIDWKATAKTGELMAREYEREEESKFCLILDTRIPNQASAEIEDSFEKAVSLAAGIAAHFLEAGSGIEFLTPNEYIPRGTGIEHLYRILGSLAVIRPEAAPADDAGLWGLAGFLRATDEEAFRQILSDKIFKIIITSKSRGTFSSAIWRSSHVVFFDEL